MPRVAYNLEKYRFSFNGQEKDDEISGQGNMTTAEYWEYDTRLGRRWNIDPVVKPWESPYSTFADNPIWFSDRLGLDTMPSNGSTVPEGFNPDKDIIQTQVVNIEYKLTFKDKLLKVWRSITSFISRQDYLWEWADNNHTNRGPVNSKNGGFEQKGPGGTKNNNLAGYPDFVSETYTSGSYLAGLEQDGVFNPIPRSSNTKTYKQCAEGIDKLVDDLDIDYPMTGGGNEEDVENKIKTTEEMAHNLLNDYETLLYASKGQYDSNAFYICTDGHRISFWEAPGIHHNAFMLSKSVYNKKDLGKYAKYIK